MSGVITSSSFAKLLWPGLNAIYGKEYNDYAVEWDKLFEKNTSDKAYEEDLGLSSFGLAVVKPEGAPISYDTERQGFTSRYNHVVYALGFIITREIYEDDLYGKVGAQKAKALARSLRQTKEIVAANVYNRAFTAGYTGGDGIVLCSTGHLNVAGGTYSNKIATDADLSEAALEQAVIDIAGYRDDRGLLIAAKPENLLFLINCNLKQSVFLMLMAVLVLILMIPMYSSNRVSLTKLLLTTILIVLVMMIGSFLLMLRMV